MKGYIRCASGSSQVLYMYDSKLEMRSQVEPNIVPLISAANLHVLFQQR
jgi:hypothetical protein